MRAFHSTSSKTRSLMLAIAMLGTAAGAAAQELTISSNQVSITQSSGGFSKTPTISNLGVVGDVTGVPVVASINVPIFSFTLEGGSGVADGAYAFNAGVVIKDVNSSRRLEIQVPTLTLNFSSGTLSGSVASGNSIVLGRDAGGGTQVRALVADDGATTISNGSVSFNAASTLSDINAGGGSPLSDIIATVNAGGSYTYTIVLKQTSNLGNILRFSTKSGSENIHLPRMTVASCDSGYSQVGGATTATSSEFVLTAGGSIASNFDNGYALQGRFAVNASPIAGTLGNIGITCKTTVASGGGGGGSNAADADVAALGTAADALITTEITADSADNIRAGTRALQTQSRTLLRSIENGATVDADTINTTIASLNSVFDQLKIIAESSSTPTKGPTRVDLYMSVKHTARAIKFLVLALKERSVNTALTTAQLAQVKIQAKSARTGFRIAIKAIFDKRLSDSELLLALSDASAIQILDSEAQALQDLIAAEQESTDAVLSISGVDFDLDFSNDLRDISQAAGESSLELLGEQLGLTITYTDDAAAQTLLSGNLELLNRLVDTILLSGGGAAEITSSTTDAALVAAGVDAAGASSLSTNLAAFVKADALSLFADSGTVLASQALINALSTETLTVDANTAEITLSAGGGAYSVAVISAGPAAPILPTGTFLLPDGTILVVNDSLAIRLASATPNLIEFAGAIAATGNYSTSIASSGKLLLTNTSTGEVFNGAFSYQLLPAGTAGVLGFDVPAIDPASDDYVITVEYADGTRQAIRPAIASSLFITSIKTAGFSVSVDSATGVVTIAGLRFKPDFMKFPLSSSDIAYLSENQDSTGVAYRTSDFNGDGTTDYQVLTINGKQIIYTQP